MKHAVPRRRSNNLPRSSAESVALDEDAFVEAVPAVGPVGEKRFEFGAARHAHQVGAALPVLPRVVEDGSPRDDDGFVVGREIFPLRRHDLFAPHMGTGLAVAPDVPADLPVAPGKVVLAPAEPVPPAVDDGLAVDPVPVEWFGGDKFPDVFPRVELDPAHARKNLRPVVGRGGAARDEVFVVVVEIGPVVVAEFAALAGSARVVDELDME